MEGLGGRGAAVVCVAMVLVLLAAGSVQGQTASYLDFSDLTRELRSLVNGSDLATMTSLGTSHEGRDVWMIEIGRRSGTPLDERPGVLVVGNLEGDHVVGSALALETVRYLLTDEAADNGGDTPLGAVLRGQVVYVVPRLNPDGAEAMFGSVLQARRRNGRTFDDDNDGRIDEDPAEDLNGDGLITAMRVPDPSGDFLVDSDDPRLMRRADPAEGESGQYTLYWEGRDSDGDGYFNEDGAGGVDLNRNFQHVYPYWERDAGPHMVSEPEARALMDFVISHRNIGAILTFGHSDNLVTAPDSRGALADASTLDLSNFADAPNADVFAEGVFGNPRQQGGPRLRGAQPGRDNDPGSGRRPAETVGRADLEYFEAVSEAYEEITGITKVGINREAEGAFFQFGYFQFGVPSFSTQGWGLPEPVAEDDEDDEDDEGDEGEEGNAEEEASPRRGGGGGESSTDATVLAAMDGAGIPAFVDWTPFNHPDLGDIEIGGFQPYTVTNPPAENLPDLGLAHAKFLVRLAGMLPRMSIVETEVTNHGDGLFTITAEVANTGYFPTSLQHGVVSRSVQPTIVQIQVEPEAILTGNPKTNPIRQLDGSGARERFTWVIRGRQGDQVDIRVRAQKGGTDTATVTLR